MTSINQMYPVQICEAYREQTIFNKYINHWTCNLKSAMFTLVMS